MPSSSAAMHSNYHMKTGLESLLGSPSQAPCWRGLCPSQTNQAPPHTLLVWRKSVLLESPPKQPHVLIVRSLLSNHSLKVPTVIYTPLFWDEQYPIAETCPMPSSAFPSSTSHSHTVFFPVVLHLSWASVINGMYCISNIADCCATALILSFLPCNYLSWYVLESHLLF